MTFRKSYNGKSCAQAPCFLRLSDKSIQNNCRKDAKESSFLSVTTLTTKIFNYKLYFYAKIMF